ncbi:MAG: TIGR02450 family Trp-rich protein [Myxococcaceae bacterium]|nr:TIGR02450 family Trp-rich protein [Myxococcaceae bacterium]
MAPPPKVARLMGSKFTSQVVREGWTHFHVVGVQRLETGWHAELAASCDGARRVRVPTTELFDRAHWVPGWTPLSQR